MTKDLFYTYLQRCLFAKEYKHGEFDKARLNKVCRQVLAKELKYVYSMGRSHEVM